MKRILFVLIAASFLVACGSNDKEEKSDVGNNEMNIKVHENIGEEIVEESYEAMSIVEEAVNNGAEVNRKILKDYQDKYIELWHHEDESLRLTKEEANLFKMTNTIIELLDDFVNEGLEFPSSKDRFLEIIQHGDSE
ncbi:hypothetical protein [Oceanobacillus alkalisoli]|uniref:hypothetical protein n=1 Tax=Oceanobacillus alkalisoli TaxID=2925113 RepID=UPI001F119C43|nr:hypothetical protein [Oceanobacillus alkalisoli]MCF3941582.1 hypothetical protein [Oceanobacillus alkalisoli]